MNAAATSRSGLVLPTLIVVSGLVAVLLAMPRAMASEPITYRFEGTIDQIDAPSGVTNLPFAIGDRYVMDITFDPDAADSDPDPNAGRYGSGVSALSVSVGSYVTPISLPDPGPGRYLVVFNNEGGGANADEFIGGASVRPRPTSSPVGPAVAGFDLFEVQFQTYDASATAILDANVDALITTPIDLSAFDGGNLSLAFTDFDCLNGCPRISVFAVMESWTLVPGGPVDADGDGVDDAIGTGAGVFDDGSGTSGRIVNASGLDVLVTDSDPGGVRITALGGGGPAEVEVCGFTLNFSAGSAATITCGSVTVVADDGFVVVVLDEASRVTIPAGSAATVDRLADGSVAIVNLGPGLIDVEVRGAVTHVAAGATLLIPSDVDHDGVIDADDMCPATATLGSATTTALKKNRYAVDEAGLFVSGDGTESGFTIQDTAGCDEHQIVDALGLGNGHEKFGLAVGVLKVWVENRPI